MSELLELVVCLQIWSVVWNSKCTCGPPYHSHADKTHFHMKGFARGLALKERDKTIRKSRLIKRWALFILNVMKSTAFISS